MMPAGKASRILPLRAPALPLLALYSPECVEGGFSEVRG
jgi:hypothetical protein